MALAVAAELQDDCMDSTQVERQYFAVLAAMKTVQSECRLLEEVIRLADESRRESRGRLVELEALRDALGKQMMLPAAGMVAERSAA